MSAAALAVSASVSGRPDGGGRAGRHRASPAGDVRCRRRRSQADAKGPD